MQTLTVFNHVSLDGYFTDVNGSMAWAHGEKDDPEWQEFQERSATGGGTLVFGRVTYDLMKSYWPTPLAAENDPVVADRMNGLQKVVFSRTLRDASWTHTRLAKGGLAAEIRKMKTEPGPGIAVLGSGSIVAQLADEGLIDDLQIVVTPVVLGKGRTLFDGVGKTFAPKLTKTRTFRNGKVLLQYAL